MGIATICKATNIRLALTLRLTGLYHLLFLLNNGSNSPTRTAAPPQKRCAALKNIGLHEQFQDMANGHFIIRKLERNYSKEKVMKSYESLPNILTHPISRIGIGI